MQTVSCPSCGAEVKFRSHASVMAVCEYCNTRVLKEAGAVRDLGKISSVLEDYSPIQINSSGVLGGRAFTVVGRIQLRYSAGMWNEWYLQFDDATTGWLGDASGQYTATSLRPPIPNPPPFEQLRAGQQYQIGDERYTASDIRTAECIGGQGELPFKVDDGWQAKVADFRRGANFVTLDYSDEGPPMLYTGVPVTLESMQMQLLRDDDRIKESAGRYRGKLDKLDCPSCGSAIQYLPGMTANLVCQACHAQIDAASPKVEVLKAGESVEAQRFTLELGATGKLGSQEFTVIGAMRRADDEGTEWTEYLLYGPRAGCDALAQHLAARASPYLERASIACNAFAGEHGKAAAGSPGWSRRTKAGRVPMCSMIGPYGTTAARPRTTRRNSTSCMNTSPRCAMRPAPSTGAWPWATARGWLNSSASRSRSPPS